MRKTTQNALRSLICNVERERHWPVKETALRYGASD